MKAGDYEAIQGDLQLAYPLLRLLDVRFPRVACNPPFGLDWDAGGSRENSTVATWRMAMGLLDPFGAGAFIAGRDRFQREVMGRPDAAGVYALVEVDDLFEGVTLPCVIAFFVAPENIDDTYEGGRLLLSASREELPQLAPQIIAKREEFSGWLNPSYHGSLSTPLRAKFEKVHEELRRRRREIAATRQSVDLALRGNRISALPSPFARLALDKAKRLREFEQLHRQPVNYFALNLREWRQLRALEQDGAITIGPRLVFAVEAAIEEAERAVCPLYEVAPQQRLAFLDDLDSIRCVLADAERGFEVGESYPIETSSNVDVTIEERPHQGRDGEYEIRRYEQEAKVLRIEIGGHVFCESAADVEYLLTHFEIPDPDDHPERPHRIAAPGEFADLLDSIAPEDALAWALAGYATARNQEIEVLEWEHVDFEENVVQLGEDKDARKSEAARRIVPMVKQLRTRFRAEWVRQGRPESGFVFPAKRADSTTGSANISALLRRIKEEWNELEKDPITLQDSRHTAATWLDHAGVSPKVASVIMGHKAPKLKDYPGAAPITLKRYTHVLKGELERACRKLEAFLAEREAEERHAAAPPAHVG